MNRQEFFNEVVSGLNRQGFQRSMTATGCCSFRGMEGRKCALGMMISDADLERQDGLSVFQVIINNNPEMGKGEEDYDFLQSIMKAHDRGYDKNAMVSLLVNVAERYALIVPDELANAIQMPEDSNAD